jgi:hypothetical protein
MYEHVFLIFNPMKNAKPNLEIHSNTMYFMSSPVGFFIRISVLKNHLTTQ